MPKTVQPTTSGAPDSGDREAFRHFGDGFAGKLVAARLQGYDSGSLSYIDVAVDGTGQLKSAASGGGGAVTVADGADVAQGATSDVAWVSGNGSLIAISKAEHAKLEAIRALLAGTLAVNVGLTDAQLRATAVPVSGPLTDAQLRASAVPVSAAALPLPAGAAQEHITAAGFHSVRLTDGAAFYDGRDITDRAARLLGVVSGGANVFHVDDNAASLTVDAPVGTPVFARLSDGAAALVGQKTMVNSLPVALASDQSIVTIAGTVQPGNTPNTTPWLVKSAIDNAVQNVLVSWEEMAGTAAVESALTNATFRTENYVALGAATSYTVPTGRRLRITNVSCYVKATSTVNNLARFRIRAVASGSVLASSPPVFDTVLALDTPGTVAAGLVKDQTYAVPEASLDFAAGAQLAFTWFTAANTCTVGLTFTGYLYTP